MPTVLNARKDHDNIKPETLPENAVYIGRGMHFLGWKPSKWRNELLEGHDGTREEIIAKYEKMICDDPVLMAALPELRGKDLVCWCSPLPCHGDVLLKLANA